MAGKGCGSSSSSSSSSGGGETTPVTTTTSATTTTTVTTTTTTTTTTASEVTEGEKVEKDPTIDSLDIPGKLRHICPYCAEDGARTFRGDQLHHSGIWLHAYRYRGKGWDYSTKWPEWAMIGGLGEGGGSSNGGGGREEDRGST